MRGGYDTSSVVDRSVREKEWPSRPFVDSGAIWNVQSARSLATIMVFCLLSFSRESLTSLLDKEKKKYFKIQSSGAAPPSSAYSQQDVKKRKLNDEKAKSRATAVARERGRIKRSKRLLEPLAGGFLEREYGQDGLDTAQILAGGLVSQGYISAMMQFSCCSAPLFAFGHRPELGPSISDLWIGEYSSLDTSTYYFHITICLFCLLFPRLARALALHQ